MFNFFSDSSRKRRYPNPNRGSSHYQKSGFFGMGSSFSRSGSSSPRRQYGYQPYPRQGQHYGMPQQNQGYAASQSGSFICPNCGASVPAGSRFCLSCGAKMASAAFCPNCGKPVPQGAKFCPECGSPTGR